MESTIPVARLPPPAWMFQANTRKVSKSLSSAVLGVL